MKKEREREKETNLKGTTQDDTDEKKRAAKKTTTERNETKRNKSEKNKQIKSLKSFYFSGKETNRCFVFNSIGFVEAGESSRKR